MAAAVSLVLAGCSDDPEVAEDGPFCVASSEYLDFERGFANVVTDPVGLETHMANWVLRLDQLVQVAPDDIRPDLEIFRTGVTTMDRQLESVDYQTLSLTLADLDTPATNDASDNYLEFIGRECGLGAAVPDPDAPAPLSDDVIAELQSEQPTEADFQALIATQLQMSLGLGDEDAECLAAAIDPTQLARLVTGSPMTEDASEAFLAAVDGCGIDRAALTVDQ